MGVSALSLHRESTDSLIQVTSQQNVMKYTHSMWALEFMLLTSTTDQFMTQIVREGTLHLYTNLCIYTVLCTTHASYDNHIHPCGTHCSRVKSRSVVLLMYNALLTHGHTSRDSCVLLNDGGKLATIYFYSLT